MSFEIKHIHPGIHLYCTGCFLLGLRFPLVTEGIDPACFCCFSSFSLSLFLSFFSMLPTLSPPMPRTHDATNSRCSSSNVEVAPESKNTKKTTKITQFDAILLPDACALTIHPEFQKNVADSEDLENPLKERAIHFQRPSSLFSLPPLPLCSAPRGAPAPPPVHLGTATELKF